MRKATIYQLFLDLRYFQTKLENLENQISNFGIEMKEEQEIRRLARLFYAEKFSSKNNNKKNAELQEIRELRQKLADKEKKSARR